MQQVAIRSIPEFVDAWQACAIDERHEFLARRSDDLSTETFVAMKERATQVIWSDAQAALALAESMRDAAELTGTPAHSAAAGIALGNVYAFGLGQYERALSVYQDATTTAEDAGDPALAAHTRIPQVYVLGMLGRYTEALSIGERVRTSAQDRDDWLTYVKATTNMAIACRRRGDYSQALHYYDEHKGALQQYLTDHVQYHELLYMLELNRSTTLRYLNRYQQAIEAARSALAVAESLETPAYIARAHDNLGLTYFLLGKYNDSLACYQKARGIFQDAHLLRDSVVVQLFEAQCLLMLNDLTAVEETCSNVIAFSRDVGMDHEEGIALTYRATSRRRRNKHEDAGTDLDRAATIFEEHENDSWLGQVYLEMAYLRLDRGDLHEASVAASAAQVCFERKDLRIERAQALLAQAIITEQQEKFNVARRAFREVRAVGQEESLAWLVYPACHGLARVARGRGHYKRARVRLDQAMNAVERLRGGMAIDLRVSFLADKLNIFADAVALALESDDTAGALHYVERAKSRALLDMFHEENSVRLQALDPDDQDIVDEINRLREQRRWFEQRAQYRPMAAGAEEMTTEERETWHQEAELCEERIESLFSELQVRNASYTATRTLSSLPDEPVGPYLPAETRLVEYYVLRDTLWAFVVSPDEVQACRLGAIAPVDDLLSRWQLQLTHAAYLGASASSHIEMAKTILGRLYDVLLAPLSDRLDGVSRLYVVPHGPLHALPFSALYDTDAGEYFVERVAVARLPSSSVLAALVQRRQHETQAGPPLILGHSYDGALPQTVVEAGLVSRITGGERHTESEASVTRLLDAEHRRPLIHVAAHGRFRSDAPLFSAIYLADGSLTALDIFNARLQTDLLVFSACESGRGTVHPGDEVVGLSRACLHAGAQSLLLSLWRVEDRTTGALMEAFYRQLSVDTTPADALCAAQRSHLANTETAHPFHWAGFSITGDAFMPIGL